jgi:ArgP family transcriptional regulator
VIEQGSFDAAAAALHVTSSAVSQRIKTLEQRVGQVLVVREKPCTATAAGIPLLRLAAQTALLEAEAMAEMGGVDGAAPRITLAVNADSMSTSLTGVLTELDDVLLDIRIEDQDHSTRLLREGVVISDDAVSCRSLRDYGQDDARRPRRVVGDLLLGRPDSCPVFRGRTGVEVARPARKVA